MTVDEAKIKVQEHWKAIAENRLGYEIVMDDTLTREYAWGWQFFLSQSIRAPRDSPTIMHLIELQANPFLSGQKDWRMRWIA